MDKTLKNPTVVNLSEKDKDALIQLGLSKLLELGATFAHDSDTTLHVRPKKYRKTKKVTPSKKRYKMSAADRALISKRMKAMWRKKRAEKTAQ